MQYIEYKPKDTLTEHIESFWNIRTSYDNSYNNELIVLPELVFDIIFVRSPILLKYHTSKKWIRLKKGVYHIGLFDTCFQFKFPQKTDIFGIRIKPFALANIKITSARRFLNQITPLFQQTDIDSNELINLILKVNNIDEKIELATNFVETIIKVNPSIQDSLRGQTNFIMERKGILKNSELYEAFDTNKATLRNQFVNNMGLSPKSVVKMMRMNSALQNKYLHNKINFTELAYSSGYFDQSHFIKDIKSIFNCSPKELFNQNNSIQVSLERINRRFSSCYAPTI